MRFGRKRDARRHDCPRRVGELGPWDPSEDNLDSWRADRDGLRTCSFCGSMHPDDFLKAVEDGLEIGPTDKTYKAYVHGYPDPRAGEQRIVGITNSVQQPDGWTGVDRKIRRQLKRDGYALGTYVLFGRRSTLELKFYFQHLDQAQRERFIELYNDGTMQLGYPGHFYTRPFFTTPVPAASGHKRA